MLIGKSFRVLVRPHKCEHIYV